MVPGRFVTEYPSRSFPMPLAIIWFGIVVLVVTEISLITPPIGLNVFVLRAVVMDVDIETIFKGVTPFPDRRHPAPGPADRGAGDLAGAGGSDGLDAVART